MKVLIVASSKLPVPAVKGGAVPNLIESLIKQNEIEDKLDLDCCSLHDSEAEEKAKKYQKTKFIWAKVPRIVKFFDKFLSFVFGKVFRCKRLHSIGFLFQVVWFSFFIAKILKKGNYDRVVFENSIPVLFSLKLCKNAKKYRDKYYLHMHSVPRKYYGNKKQIRNCRALICISEYVANAIVEDQRLKFDKSKIRIMYNCLDTNLFKALPNCDVNCVKQKYLIKKDKKTILFVGRLCAEKGIAELLKAIKILDKEDIQLVVVGSNFYKAEIVSPYESYLREICESFKERVVFTGFVDYCNLPEVYAIADIVVLPSMWEEPAGMTMIEAMACQRPLITTISGGIPEYVGKDNCVLLERNDTIIQELAKTMADLLNNTEKAKIMSQKARKQVEKFNEGFYFEQFLSILGE